MIDRWNMVHVIACRILSTMVLMLLRYLVYFRRWVIFSLKWLDLTKFVMDIISIFFFFLRCNICHKRVPQCFAIYVNSDIFCQSLAQQPSYARLVDLPTITWTSKLVCIDLQFAKESHISWVYTLEQAPNPLQSICWYVDHRMIPGMLDAQHVMKDTNILQI